MKVGVLMRREVVRATVEDNLPTVAQRMRSLGVSALPVFREDRLVGIITERYLVHALANDLDTRVTHVSACMTPGPISAAPDDDATAAALVMLERGVRHLPVVEWGELIGMVSARDLLMAKAEKG